MSEAIIYDNSGLEPRLIVEVRSGIIVHKVDELPVWALEVGEVARFPSITQAASYYGLTSAQHNSAGKEQRRPISKQRNKHLQTMLIEHNQLCGPCPLPTRGSDRSRQSFS